MTQMAWIVCGVIASALLAIGAVATLIIRRRHMHYWLPAYIGQSIRRRKHRDDQPRDVFIAICDHYEPEAANADPKTALARVQRWHDEYPRLVDAYRDCSGRVPQHTFFFPQDHYRPEYLDVLADLCNAGYGDVDVHLHHDNDTPEQLYEKLTSFRDDLFHRHGLLRRDPVTDEIVYGFIHGNWALCNARPDGRWCGVDREIPILRETGCYADFTMPSAPSNAQTSTINSIYYAFDKGDQPKAHDTGLLARAGQPAPDDGLLMIQGPLSLNWSSRKMGIIPRTENGDIHGTLPPTVSRFRQWLKTGVHVEGRPEWVFVKLHTHGCKPRNMNSLLGPEMSSFHTGLADYTQHNPKVRYHYVTAWEMAAIVHAAERGEADWQSALTSGLTGSTGLVESPSNAFMSEASH